MMKATKESIMEESQNQENQSDRKTEEKKSLQSDDKEVLENRKPREGSDPISEAGKKRDDSKRYQ